MKSGRHVAALSLSIVLCARPVFAFPVFAPPVHSALVFLHVLGAIVFMGNMIVSALWMAAAKRTGEAGVLHFAARTVVRADWALTLPGIVLILVPGMLVTGPYGGFPGTSWAELALSFFLLSGIIWGAVLIPTQRRMVATSGEDARSNRAPSAEFHAALAKWMTWGGIATLLPFAALVLMVFKPRLWG